VVSDYLIPAIAIVALLIAAGIYFESRRRNIKATQAAERERRRVQRERKLRD
jgi:hypothetical protein